MVHTGRYREALKEIEKVNKAYTEKIEWIENTDMYSESFKAAKKEQLKEEYTAQIGKAKEEALNSVQAMYEKESTLLDFQDDTLSKTLKNMDILKDSLNLRQMQNAIIPFIGQQAQLAAIKTFCEKKKMVYAGIIDEYVYNPERVYTDLYKAVERATSGMDSIVPSEVYIILKDIDKANTVPDMKVNIEAEGNTRFF